MRIRRVFLLSIALGSAVGVLAALLFAIQQWSSYQIARAARHDTVLLTIALRLPEMLTLERALIIPRLVASDASTAEQLAPILQQTQRADTTLREMRGLAVTPSDIIAVHRVKDKILAVRAGVLATITRQRPEPSDAIIRAYISDMFAVQTAAYAFATSVQERINAINPRVGQATRLALLAWDLRDWSGRQTTLFVGYLAQRLPMADQQAETLAIYKGRIDQRWAVVQTFADAVNTPEVTAAVDKVQRGFWDQGGEVYEAYVVPSHGQILDLAPDLFTTSSRPVLDSILPLRDVALNEALRECNARIIVRRRGFLLAFGLLLLAACATTAAMRWFDRQVLRPIREITTIILSLARGKRDMEVPLKERGGELGQMAQAIDTLRRNAIQAAAIGDEMLALQKARADEKSQLLTELTQTNEELAALNAELEALAATDALTGVPNRRSFDLCLTREWRRAKRESMSLGLLLLDVDHFKSFNDRYGHPAGDACLGSVATAIASTIQRPGDTTARYGGEEFAMILPETDLEGAVNVAERVRHAVAALNIRHLDNTGGIVTISIGVSVTTPWAADSPEDLVRAADTALYAAKRGGRNKVVTAPRIDALPQDA